MFEIIALGAKVGVMSSLMNEAGDVVGRTSSLYYYYLAFVVLTYLAHLIGVNTSKISSSGTTDLGIQALIALDWLFGESEDSSLSPSIYQ
jgi:hypothetical protein